MKYFYAELIVKREAGGIIVLEGHIVRAANRDKAWNRARQTANLTGRLGVRGVYPISARWAEQLIADDQAVLPGSMDAPRRHA